MRKILLVEPAFPIPSKSKNHKNFLPVGLLKIASYLRENGTQVRLIRGIPSNLGAVAEISDFAPNETWVTSLFTYWAQYVTSTVQYYKELLPQTKVVVGGIYASLLPKDEVKEYTGCDEVYQGAIPEAERCLPAYDLIENANSHPIDYQIIHTSRGCSRRCRFCGTWIIEPVFTPERSIKDKIKYRKVVFYDNNFLMNPYVEDILWELIELKRERKLTWCESQSGFDGRILLERPHLARMIKEAGFRDPRIAWDWKYEDHEQIKRQIDSLVDAGYSPRGIYVFMIYNWELPFEEMEKKRIKCWEWKVQIADCRYRPLNQLYDNYHPWKLGQGPTDYYIHADAGWIDALVKQFRRNVRQQNICVRHGFHFYSDDFEQKEFDQETMRVTKGMQDAEDKKHFLNGIKAGYWFPDQVRFPAQ